MIGKQVNQTQSGWKSREIGWRALVYANIDVPRQIGKNEENRKSIEETDRSSLVWCTPLGERCCSTHVEIGVRYVT